MHTFDITVYTTCSLSNGYRASLGERTSSVTVFLVSPLNISLESAMSALGARELVFLRSTVTNERAAEPIERIKNRTVV